MQHKSALFTLTPQAHSNLPFVNRDVPRLSPASLDPAPTESRGTAARRIVIPTRPWTLLIMTILVNERGLGEQSGTYHIPG